MDVKTFLFGSSNTEGFHCLTGKCRESTYNLESRDKFELAIQNILLDIDSSEPGAETFEFPDDKTLDDWYLEQKLAQFERRMSFAEGLDDLLSALNDAPEELIKNDIIDVCDLPTFGGERPRDTSDIWSWDETRLMIGGDGGMRFQLAPRSFLTTGGAK